jgi:hypothetical protein
MSSFKLNKAAFSISDLDDKDEEKKFWFAKTPEERIQATETMRQILYGYDPTTTRLQRVFEVIDLKHLKENKKPVVA